MPLIKHHSATARFAAPFRSDVRKAAGDDPQAATGQAEEPIETAYVARIATLEAALRKAERETDALQKEAYDRGRTEGLREAEDNSRDLLALVKTSLNEATATISDTIDRQRDIGIALARAVLTEIFGDRSRYSGMVASVAQRWSEHLADETLLTLRVSRADFPDEISLAQLTEQLGPSSWNSARDHDGIEVRADASLESGACIFALKLGQLDASIPMQALGANRLLEEFDLLREAAE